MDLLERAAIGRAQAALSVASSRPVDTRQDDEHFAGIVRSLVHGDSLPPSAAREHDELLRQGHVNEHGGHLVPISRIFSRDLTTETGSGTSKAGYLIGTGVLDLVPELGAVPQVIRAGATLVTGLTRSSRLPTLTAGATGTWLETEGSAPTESAPTFGSVTLTPRTVSCFVDISRMLQMQGAHSIEGLMRQHLARAIARSIDSAALNGTGANGQPAGIANISGVGSAAMGTNGAALTRARIRTIIETVADQQGLAADSAPAFMINTSTAMSSYATETSSGSGRYLYEPIDAIRGSLGGFGAFVNDSLPNNLTKASGSNLSRLIFGDWRQVVVAMWSGAELFANPFAASTTGATRLHAFLSCDIGVGQPAAFCVSNDVTTP